MFYLISINRISLRSFVFGKIVDDASDKILSNFYGGKGIFYTIEKFQQWFKIQRCKHESSLQYLINLLLIVFLVQPKANTLALSKYPTQCWVWYEWIRLDESVKRCYFVTHFPDIEGHLSQIMYFVKS